VPNKSGECGARRGVDVVGGDKWEGSKCVAGTWGNKRQILPALVGVGDIATGPDMAREAIYNTYDVEFGLLGSRRI